MFLDLPFSTVADASVVAMGVVLMPADVDVAAYEKEFALATGAGSKPDGFIAGVKGWATEEIDDHPKLPGIKAKVFVTATAWESLEAHKEAHAAEVERFKELARFDHVLDIVSQPNGKIRVPFKL